MGVRFQFFLVRIDSLPLWLSPPRWRVRCAPMLSGGAPTIGAAKRWMHVNDGQTNTSPKPTRVGVQADDIGAQRLEETRAPRDGGFEGEFRKLQKKTARRPFSKACEIQSACLRKKAGIS